MSRESDRRALAHAMAEMMMPIPVLCACVPGFAPADAASTHERTTRGTTGAGRGRDGKRARRH